MKKSTAQKDILYISISSCILVILWVGFNIYHAHVTSTIEPDLQLQIQPIEPRFDSEVIQNLKTRQTPPAIFKLNNATSEAELSPTPTIAEAPSITETPPAPTGSETLILPIEPTTQITQ